MSGIGAHRPPMHANVDAPAPGLRWLWRLISAVRTALVDPATVFCACFVVAYCTRLYGADLITTSDEGYWMQRTVRFGAALERGAFEQTYRVGHPGVTVMWVGVAGLGPERLARYIPQRFTAYTTLERDDGYLEAFAAARLAMILVTSALIATVVTLICRLAGNGPGLLGGTLLLLDPYVVGMTRLLHVDALLAPLMCLSALAGLIWWRGGRPGYLVLSATAGGLALLTKAPAAYLPLFFAAVGLLSRQMWCRPVRWLAGLATWGIVAVLTYVAAWPAMWVDPLDVAGHVVAFAQREGGQPHNWSNFFLGSATTEDPGLLFYPVALAYRLGPVALGGLVAAVLLARRRSPEAAMLAGLGGYALGFVVLMTVGGKKFDRYMLPAIVMLDLLAGVGLWMLARRVRRGVLRCSMLASAALIQVVLLWNAYPYPIAAYNPLLGGAAGAQQAMLIGWGEGLDQVAAYLNRQPGAERRVASTLYHHALRPLFRGKTQRIVEPLSPDYFVVYVNMAQRGLIPAGIDDLIRDRIPELTVRIHGVEYARVYRLTPGLPVQAPPVAPDDEHPDTEGG